jgi:hypothetical protein
MGFPLSQLPLLTRAPAGLPRARSYGLGVGEAGGWFLDFAPPRLPDFSATPLLDFPFPPVLSCPLPWLSALPPGLWPLD